MGVFCKSKERCPRAFGPGGSAFEASSRSAYCSLCQNADVLRSLRGQSLGATRRAMRLLTPEQLANYLGGLPPDVGVHLLGERRAGAAELRATRSRTPPPRGQAAGPAPQETELPPPADAAGGEQEQPPPNAPLAALPQRSPEPAALAAPDPTQVGIMRQMVIVYTPLPPKTLQNAQSRIRADFFPNGLIQRFAVCLV